MGAAIKKYIAANYKVDIVKLSPLIRKAVKKLVESKKIAQTKGTGASGRFKAVKEAAKPKKAEYMGKPKKKAVKKVKKTAAKKTPKKAKKPAAKKSPKKAAKKPKTPKKAAAKKPAAKKAVKKSPKKAAKKAAPKKK